MFFSGAALNRDPPVYTGAGMAGAYHHTQHYFYVRMGFLLTFYLVWS
jgi:hypothetical protein